MEPAAGTPAVARFAEIGLSEGSRLRLVAGARSGAPNIPRFAGPHDLWFLRLTAGRPRPDPIVENEDHGKASARRR